MSDFGNHKWVKTRKTHPCVYCNRTIPTGTKARNYKGRWQGDWQDWYACGFCVENVEPTHTESDEPISGEEFIYWLQDSDHWKCPTCGEHRYNHDWEWREDDTGVIITCGQCDHEWAVAIPFECPKAEAPND